MTRSASPVDCLSLYQLLPTVDPDDCIVHVADSSSSNSLVGGDRSDHVPVNRFLYHGAKLRHADLQWRLPFIFVLTCYASQVGLALHPEGDHLLAAHLSFSFQGPLVLVCAVGILILCELSYRLRFMFKTSGAVHPTLRT